jgi:hypothetical protein
MPAIEEAVRGLSDRGVDVMSPADPRVVDQAGDFLFVASDRHRSIRLVQDRHLSAIAVSDFLWLVCPDGYVGSSAAMEIGAAAILRTPVFAETAPLDSTLSRYVVITSMGGAMRVAEEHHTEPSQRPLLLDPDAVLGEVANTLDELRALLRGQTRVAADELWGRVASRSGEAARLLAVRHR